MKPILRFNKYLLRCLILAVLSCGVIYQSSAQAIDFGKSYINVTKGSGGGTIEPGDELEIRASFVVRSGTYDSCGYFDAVPTGTSYKAGTLRVLTNEGKIYKQFTDAANDDEGWITGGVIRINLGYNPAASPATAFRRGRVANTHKPKFGATCILIASFRVIVIAGYGTDISTGGGSITYKNGIAAMQTFTFPGNIVRVYNNYGICANTIGGNALGTEFNGTFGTGKLRNRGSSVNVPAGYTYNVFTTSGPNDYFYGIANNTSTNVNYTTVNSWPKPDNSAPSHRVFNVWDIIGDHTGAASPTSGNTAADTVANANAGYMLVINAAYRIDSAFQQTISNLCPNTYYEISCWMRNICSKCGSDSNGTSAISGSTSYIPVAPGDSSGVTPNLTFDIDGIDYYTTGNLAYSGTWVKKGFTYLTGPSQTSFTLKFFNNAPGGGGNDWALDDISVATCSPNMSYSPTLNPTICKGNTLKLYDTIRSYFNNYTYYKWQRSTDNGAIWTDVTGVSGPSAPVLNGSNWQYVSSYTVPPANTTPANNADKYRLVVATTPGNLSTSNCNFTDAGNVITMNVIDCGAPLNIQLLSFTGKINNNNALLTWSTAQEKEALDFEIERSFDGIEFSKVATQKSYRHYGDNLNAYNYSEPLNAGVTYYRIKTINSQGDYTYSREVKLLSVAHSFEFTSVINPFSDQLRFAVGSPGNSKANAFLIDLSGRVVRQSVIELITGINALRFTNTNVLKPGIYILSVRSEQGIIQKTVFKREQ